MAVVGLGPNRVMDSLKHDEVEGVVAVGFEVGGRLVTGGGTCVKVWEPSQSNNWSEKTNGSGKRLRDDEESDEDDEDSEEEVPKQEAKRKKKGRKKDRGWRHER